MRKVIIATAFALVAFASTVNAEADLSQVNQSSSIIKTVSPEQLWQEYLNGKPINASEVQAIISYVDSDKFLAKIHTLNQLELQKFNNIWTTYYVLTGK